jgi:tetratricopeptide (TPR) repeat protein
MLMLLTICSVSGFAQEDPITRSETLFKANEYKEGMAVLKTALRDKNIDEEMRIQIYNRLAKGFEEFTGDFKQATRYYIRTLKSDLPMDHPSKTAARQALDRLKALQQKYASVNNIFDGIRNVSFRMKKTPQIEKQIAQLETIINEHPDYYRLAEVYFILGMYNMAVERYREAFESMDKSMETRPGIYLKFPVKSRREEALKHYEHFKAYDHYIRITYRAFGILFGITLIMLFISRPWKWMRKRSLVIGLAILLAWPCIFYPSLMILAKVTNPQKTVEDEALKSSKKPQNAKAMIVDAKSAIDVQIMSGANPDVHTRPTEAGGNVVNILCLYGLAGVAWTLLFVIGTGKLKIRPVAFLMNFIFAAVTFTTLSTHFYFQHCYGKGSSYGESFKANIVYYLYVAEDPDVD